MNDRDLHLEVI